MANVEVQIQGNKVVYTKYVDAPIDLVFEVWSSAEHLAQWWGPDGFTLSTSKMEFKEGGAWNFVMHGPDGKDWPCFVKYVEVRSPELIYYQHVDGAGDGRVLFESWIRLSEANGVTCLVMEQVFPSVEELERLAREVGAIEGGKQHLGNMEKYVGSLL